MTSTIVDSNGSLDFIYTSFLQFFSDSNTLVNAKCILKENSDSSKIITPIIDINDRPEKTT